MDTGTYERLNEGVTTQDEVSIAELYLVMANMEKLIDDHLLQNGVFLDPKTRRFLASIRDVMGATSRRAKRAATASKT